MKKLMTLMLLTAVLVASCSYLDGSEAKRRGRECMYNSRGEVQVCGYIN